MIFSKACHLILEICVRSTCFYSAPEVLCQCLTLWLCSDSCHTCGVPGQKWPDSKQLLINLSLCYIITKYWIQSFCQLVFFHLGLVLCFYLHLINHWSTLVWETVQIFIIFYLILWKLFIKKDFFTQKTRHLLSDKWGLRLIRCK